MELIAIPEDGAVNTAVNVPEAANEMIGAMVQLYEVVGYEPPWIGYLAIEDGECVGSCAFKSPPADGRVEIAYFTFPNHEGRGIATRMAAELIRLAFATHPNLTVAAQTLPEENASTSILNKLGFEHVGCVDHPEDGPVWEWQLTNS